MKVEDGSSLLDFADEVVARSPTVDWEAVGHVLLDADALRAAGRLTDRVLLEYEGKLRAIPSLAGTDLDVALRELRQPK